MKKCFFTLFVIFTFAATSIAQQIALTGTVKRADAVPIESLTVVLENGGTPAAETITDALGNYALTVNAGSYTALRVRNQDRKKDGIPSSIEHTAVSNLTLSKDTIVDITMPAYIHIHGKVKDADSNEVANANIVIKRWEGSEMTPWDKDVSAGDGAYSLYMEPGGVKFWITPQGGQEVTKIDTFDADTQMDIYLPELYTLSGTVTNFTGDTLHNITVAIEKENEQYEAHTDVNGFYSKVLNPGSYRIRLRNGVAGVAEKVPSTMEETKIDTFAFDRDSTLNLKTLYYPALRCSVVNSSGAPVENVAITSKKWLGSESTPWDFDTTNGEGLCTLYVAEGNNKLWIWPPNDTDYVQISFEISVANDSSITIVMPDGVTLSGKVFRADSTAVEGVSVALEKDADQWMETTGAQGEYQFRMQAGNYRLRVRNMNSTISGIPSTLEHTVQETLSLAQSDTINIYLPLFPVVSGIVKDPSGNPVSGAGLTAKRWDGAEMPPWDECVSGTDGAYSLTVGAGTNKIWVTPPGGSGLGAFSFIENYDSNTIKDIYIPDQARGITRFQPSVITRGNSGEVMVNGINSNFTGGAVVIDLGANVTVSNIQVVSNITLLADVSIDSTAETGSRDVKVTVGSQSLIGPNLLTVTAQAKDTCLLDANNKTTREIIISDGTGTELRIPKGTEVEFPGGADQSIAYESPILQGDDPTVTGDLLEVQKKLYPSGVVFKDTVYMTVQYKDQDVEGIDETKLIPYFYFDNDTGGTMGDSMIVLEQDTAANTIVFAIPHFSMFRLATGSGSNSIIPINNVNAGRTRMLSLSKALKQYVTLSFYIDAGDAKQEITLQVFDLKGRLIRTLIHGIIGSGTHSAQWDGRSVHGALTSNGFYILNLRIGERTTLFRSFIVAR